jgi:hypothetical protein
MIQMRKLLKAFRRIFRDALRVYPLAVDFTIASDPPTEEREFLIAGEIEYGFCKQS